MVRLVLIVALVAVIGVVWRRKIADVPARFRLLADAAEVITLVVLMAMVVALAVMNLRTPAAWDFPVFYTVARNVVLGTSFYDPAALLPTFTEIQQAGVPGDWLSGGFGFWYAPPTALVLAPVGVSSYTVGLTIQYVIQGAFFASAVVVLHRAFPLRSGAMGLVEMGIMCLAFRPVVEAFTIAQIVFGALFFLAMSFVAVRDRPGLAGVYLGIGALFKHLLVIPALLMVVLGRVRVALGALAALGVSAVVAVIVFGWSVFEEFVVFGPSDRPPSIALDSEIESLNGFLRRALGDVPDSGGAIEAILYPPYLVIAAILTAATIVIVWLRRDRNHATLLGLSAFTSLALIVYPNTLYNTLPLILPVIILVLYLSDELSIPTMATVGMVIAAYALVVTRATPGIVMLAMVWGFALVALTRQGAEAPSMVVNEEQVV